MAENLLKTIVDGLCVAATKYATDNTERARTDHNDYVECGDKFRCGRFHSENYMKCIEHFNDF